MAQLITLGNLARFKTNCDKEYLNRKNVDTTPRDDSTNVVTSGGVKAYVDSLIESSGGSTGTGIIELSDDYDLDALTETGLYYIVPTGEFAGQMIMVVADKQGFAAQYSFLGDEDEVNIKYRCHDLSGKGWTNWTTVATKSQIDALQTSIKSLNTSMEGKADNDLSNVEAPTARAGNLSTGNDRVIQIYISGDGSTWYRKWKSGWKECGGKGTNIASSTITLPLTFSNTNYIGLVLPNTENPKTTAYIFERTTSQIKVGQYGELNAGFDYYCCGY